MVQLQRRASTCKRSAMREPWSMMPMAAWLVLFSVVKNVKSIAQVALTGKARGLADRMCLRSWAISCWWVAMRSATKVVPTLMLGCRRLKVVAMARQPALGMWALRRKTSRRSQWGLRRLRGRNVVSVQALGRRANAVCLGARHNCINQTLSSHAKLKNRVNNKAKCN